MGIAPEMSSGRWAAKVYATTPPCEYPQMTGRPLVGLIRVTYSIKSPTSWVISIICRQTCGVSPRPAIHAVLGARGKMTRAFVSKLEKNVAAPSGVPPRPCRATIMGSCC